ncbi:hypothetical protein [Archangium lansingense]|uniref:Uncharacterized protein n=1 Tax=Archangium lansingense TaxID=2995310 RepID=A0ABT4ALH5_9BACT|nr:hypothetical protein [Archangium lansinium]MCY1082538.1 hypothetical protein [Archangium lansinium]
MERSRAPVRTPEASGEVVPEPVSLEPPPSARWLLEQVRAPGVARAEVDALLRGLELPLGPGEAARERADLLHGILEDEEVREYTGTGGRKVGHVAVLQLVELGFPYALEVPPELFAQARAAGSGGAPQEGSSRGGPKGWMVVLAGGLEALPALALATSGLGTGGGSDDITTALSWFLVVSLTSFVPAFLADTEPVLRRRWLHYLMLLAMALPALPWLAATALVFAAADGKFWALLFFVLPLGMALLRLIGARSLYGPAPEAKPAEESDEEQSGLEPS